MTPDDIEAEYRRLGYQLGWSFLYGPEHTLRTAEFAIVGLNPGGDRAHPPQWSLKNESAWVHQRWDKAEGYHCPGQSPLQRQVRRMCELLNLDPIDTLSAQFVPFRSPSWSALPRRREALEFGRRLWRWVLDQSSARTFICIGKNVTAVELATVLGASRLPSVEANWGSIRIDRYQDRTGRLIVGLPHLSRFGLFYREGSEAAFIKAIKKD